MEARMLFMDFEIIFDAALEFPEESWEQHAALNTASRIIDTFEAGDKSSIRDCRKIAAEFLGPNINSCSSSWEWTTRSRRTLSCGWSLPHRYLLAVATGPRQGVKFSDPGRINAI